MKNAIVTYQRDNSGAISVSIVETNNPKGFESHSYPYATSVERCEILNNTDAVLSRQNYTLVHVNTTLQGVQRFYAQE
jgi:hypothetical protein